MKQTISLIMLVGLIGCGQKTQPAPTEYEQKISRIERAEREWAAEKKTLQTYSLGYYRHGYYVELDIIKDEVVARCQVTVAGEKTIETGDEIGSHEWGNTPPVTLDDVYAECRNVVKENPATEFFIHLAGDLLWCDGNFGTKGLEQGTTSIGTNDPRCNRRPSD